MGNKLFATAKSLAVHKATIKHIRRNCLSDSPGVSYYSPIRKDRYGLTIYYCHRGTPGNEGLHQKLRQLVRGFSNSPQYIFALLTNYFRIWNQNIDIALRGLPSKYDGLYCGDLLEDEIEKMAKWKHRETPPHPEWLSTRSVQCSSETFGFLLQDSGQRSDDGTTSSSVSICSDAAAAADELLDGAEYDEEAEMASNMPASAQWMAGLNGKFRPYGKVIGNTEWDYFKSNITKFHGSRDGYEADADNYSSIRWSDFTFSWNKWVDSLGVKSSDVTYKTAAYLKAAYKSMKRRAIQSSTLRPHKLNIDSLRKSHTNEDANRTFIDSFYESEPAAPLRPKIAIPEMSVDANQNDQEYLADSSDSERVGVRRMLPKETKPKQKQSKKRCRKCGKCYALREWKPFHQNNIASEEDWGERRPCARHLRNGPGNKVWDYCTVDPALYEDGYPCLDQNKAMPRKRSRAT
jgi:hypothetical protein